MTSRVRYYGCDFDLDVDRLRHALVLRCIQEGVDLGGFATIAGVSRMTLWRLKQGKVGSLPVLRRLLVALRLEVGDVLQPV